MNQKHTSSGMEEDNLRHSTASRLPSLSRPRRKSMSSNTEMSAAGLSVLIPDDGSSKKQGNFMLSCTHDLVRFYSSQRKHIWFTACTILVFIISFIVFQLLYPQASPAASSGSSVPPDGCFIPDISGCYDFQSCIAPGFNSSQYPHLVQPDCSDTMNKCKYPCKCAVSTAAELRDADFSISRFLFFSPKVPIVQAVLGSAFLLCLLATVTLRQTRSPSDMYMAGSGKSDYEEWMLYAYPAKRTVQGVAMMTLFLCWALYQFVAFAWLVLPTLDVVDKFTKTDCLLTPMVDNRFCWTLVFIIPAGVVFLMVGSLLDRFKSLVCSHCAVSEATRVELVLVKIISTKLKGEVVRTTYTTRFVQQLQKQGPVISFEAFGVRYVFLGESCSPQFIAVGELVMSNVTMAAINSYFTKAVEGAGVSNALLELPYSKSNLSADAERLVKQCQPLSRPYEAACIIGQNYVPIEVPSFVEAWLLELSKPFYVFQFMCCVLWTIDNYIPYGYGLMFLLFLGSSQAAYVTIRSKKDMRALVDKRYDVEVLRQGGWTRIDRCELLPGDVVKILAGAPVPADCILMSGSVLMDESMLTGEALPLSKSHLEHMDDKVYTPMMKKCTLYGDTVCLKSNDAIAIVGKTGMFTEKGRLLQALIMPADYQPQYQKEANFALFLMFLYSIWNYVIVVFLNSKKDPTSQFKCANFIYGLEAVAMVIPPILPLAILIGLNVSVARLNKQRIFTFQVNRIGIIGGTKIMCFDKTGTITEEGMRFKSVRPVAVSSGVYAFEQDDWTREDLSKAPESLLAKAMATCHSLEELQGQLVGNQVDMEMFGGVGFQPSSTAKTYQQGAVVVTVVKQFEFIHALQTMAVIVRDTSGAHHAFCKGSYERVKLRLKPSSIPANYDSVCTDLAKKGAYVLAVGGKSLEGKDRVQQLSREDVECDLSLLGLLVFLNDIKKSSPAAFRTIADGGIDCRIITGDNAFTAVKVARSISMNGATASTRYYVGDVKQDKLVFKDYDTDAEVSPNDIFDCVDKSLIHFNEVIQDKCPPALPFALCVTGAALEFLDNELKLEQYHAAMSKLNLVPAITIFARVSPFQKAEIVTDIEEAGAIVGMCGDGGNDVNALRQATFGFALSTTDAGIAAPFSTNRKDLTSLVELLIEGRASLTTNFGAFKYMLTYGLFYSFYNLGNNFHGGYFSTKQFYWMDFGINLLLTIGVTSSNPASVLIKGLPPSSIYSLPVQLSIWSPCVISAVLLIVLYFWTTSQTWYKPTATMFADGSQFPSDALVQGIMSKNYLGTVYFHACSWSLMWTAVIYTFGGYFRKPIWQNKALMLSMAALLLVSSFMILLPSETGNKVDILKSTLADPPFSYEVNVLDEGFDLFPLPSNFKLQLFFLIFGFMIAMAISEQAILYFFQRIDGKSGWDRMMDIISSDERALQREIELLIH